MGAGGELESPPQAYEACILPLKYPAYGSPGRSRTYDPMINSHLSHPTGLLVNGGQSWI